MTIRRLSSRTHPLDKTFLLEYLKGARSYKRIADYFTSSLFEAAQLRKSKMIGRWNENAIEAEALINRPRYPRVDELLAKHGQVIRVTPDSIVVVF